MVVEEEMGVVEEDEGGMTAQMDVDGAEGGTEAAPQAAEDLILPGRAKLEVASEVVRVTTAMLRPQRDLPTIFFSLYGAQADGPICYMLETDSVTILLDCGWDETRHRHNRAAPRGAGS